ncbi:MAG: hypothetical protein ACFFCS_08840 [Candidatus Hodarchaeota archaeon]
MTYRVHGRVRRSDNGQGISNLVVTAYDADWISADDYLGRDTTNNQGYFDIQFSRDDFDAGWFDPEGGPDIYLKVVNPQGRLLYKSGKRSDAGKDTSFIINLNSLDLLGQYTVRGKITDRRSGRELCNLKVEAWDDDFIFDDKLGSAKTDRNGNYLITFEEDDFKGLFEGKPDVYIKIFNDSGRLLASSATRHEAGRHTEINAKIGGVDISRNVSECIYSWTAAYRQEGTHIIVRIELDPDATIPVATIQNLQNTWKIAIEDKWGDRFACCCNKLAKNTLGCRNSRVITFDVQWVTSNAHHVVRVRPGPARSNMTTWDTSDTGDVASHEFGHMLGLVDEYADVNCPTRSPVNTGTVMDDNTEVVERHMEHLCHLLNENAVPVVRIMVGPILPKLERPPSETSEDELPEKMKIMKIEKDSRPKLLELMNKIVEAKQLKEDDIKILQKVTGGPPGQRYEWQLNILGSGRVDLSIVDELHVKQEKYSTELDEKTVINLLNEIVTSRILEIKDDAVGFIPDSLVGTITISIGDLRTMFYYLADVEQRREQKSFLKSPVFLIDKCLNRVAERTIKRDDKLQEELKKKLEK